MSSAARGLAQEWSGRVWRAEPLDGGVAAGDVLEGAKHPCLVGVGERAPTRGRLRHVCVLSACGP